MNSSNFDTNAIVDLRSFLQEWRKNVEYFEMLGLLARLSKLFSESSIPYLDYRLAENIFCKYYNAKNHARSCIAFDAELATIGVGVKTFILKNDDQSIEKIAEFDKLKLELDACKGLALAKKLAFFWNKRIDGACGAIGSTEMQYHIVGRKERLLRIFNSPFERIDEEHIHLEYQRENSIRFSDGKNEYSFYGSKSVLQKRFVCPKEYHDIDVTIEIDPYNILKKIMKKEKKQDHNENEYDYVILPLYSTRLKRVPEKSGLNQWNAGGRLRDPNEIYIPIPAEIHKRKPNFFPKRDEPFMLDLSNGKSIVAKVCQKGDKGLMSNPNCDLGRWILRDVMKKEEYDLVTLDDLKALDVDSVKIEKVRNAQDDNPALYRISFSNNYDSYEQYIGNSLG